MSGLVIWCRLIRSDMTDSSTPFYETDKAVSEYLLFHYGKPEEQLPHAFGPASALNYPVRCISECLDLEKVPTGARGLDLGCAVGRSSFELAKHCEEVIGIDFSHAFVERANQLKSDGCCHYTYAKEGSIQIEATAEVDSSIDRSRLHFQQEDAMKLPRDLGTFHVVLMANLIDRLTHPTDCLSSLASLMESGGQLIITSPYTWLEEYTPKENWLGGYEDKGKNVSTLDGLKGALEKDFDLQTTKDLPFLIREHARKYQWSVAQASIWLRK